MLQFCRILLLIIFLSPVTRVAAEQLRLTGVNFSNHGSTKIAFQLSGAAHYRFFTLTNPNRLVVDFIDTRLSQAFVQPDPNHPLIQTIRSGTRNAHDLRVVLELKSAVESAGNLLNQANGSELQLDLVSKYQPAIQSAGLSNLNPVTSLSINKKPALDIKETKETVSFVKPVNIINTPAKGRDITVAIDAGHGGKDVGAQGNNGTQEKDVVFAIAKRLESLVNSQPGLHAVMIRKGDYFVKLNERVRIAEEAKADLFVSIHADAFNDSSANGASVYTLANKGASSAGARWLADSENASDQVADGGSAEKNDTLASVLHDLTQTAAKEASQNVGSKVLRNVKTVCSTLGLH